ncbi:MAG: hypothetical protein ACM3U1_06485 [Chloroflexota bacterium]
MKVFTILIALAMLAGCSGKLPECMPKNSEKFRIRWGDLNETSQTTAGYELTNEGVINLYVRKGSGEPTREKLGKLEEARFCSLVRLINQKILSTQALYVPADQANFIEYENPEYNAYIRGVWNPKYTTEGNKDFREAYDSLQAAVSELGIK